MESEFAAEDGLYRAYGEFMATWADAERELFYVLSHYAGLQYPISGVIFSGYRAEQMIVTIKNIFSVQPPTSERSLDFIHVAKQLNQIKEMRDKLAHNFSANSYGTDPSRLDGRAFSNGAKAKNPKHPFVNFIDAQTLKDMTFDLQGIINHLNQHHGSYRTTPFRPWREDPANDVPTAWLYKSPPP